MRPQIHPVDERLPVAIIQPPGATARFDAGLSASSVGMRMPHAIHSPIDAGMLIASLTAVGRNVPFHHAESAGKSNASNAVLAAENGH